VDDISYCGYRDDGSDDRRIQSDGEERKRRRSPERIEIVKRDASDSLLVTIHSMKNQKASVSWVLPFIYSLARAREAIHYER
jgi:hypothetical protein